MIPIDLGRLEALNQTLEKSPSPPSFCASVHYNGLRSDDLCVVRKWRICSSVRRRGENFRRPVSGGQRRVGREAGVWLRANMCDYNQEVLSRQLLFTI